MADLTTDLEQRLRLAHQARRAKEHQLDDIRRAMCDAGLMQDDDPYGHADLAGVIRQVGMPAMEKPVGDVCGHPGHPVDPCQPCALPLGHDWHRDGDGCSWPAVSGPLLDRKAIRNVLLYVSGCVYSMHRDYVEELTDRLFELYCGEAARLPGPASPAPCSISHDCPGQPRTEPLTAHGEPRCQSQYRPEGEQLVQCALAVHGSDGPHTDFDPDEPTAWPAGSATITRHVWNTKHEEARRG